jgi:hypothetical protein
MRLTLHQYQAIKKHFLEIFEEGEIFLFGSMVENIQLALDGYQNLKKIYNRLKAFINGN